MTYFCDGLLYENEYTSIGRPSFNSIFFLIPGISPTKESVGCIKLTIRNFIENNRLVWLWIGNC